MIMPVCESTIGLRPNLYRYGTTVRGVKAWQQNVAIILISVSLVVQYHDVLSRTKHYAERVDTNE